MSLRPTTMAWTTALKLHAPTISTFSKPPGRAGSPTAIAAKRSRPRLPARRACASTRPTISTARSAITPLPRKRRSPRAPTPRRGAAMQLRAFGRRSCQCRKPAAFALCRPPGHHAAIDLYGGYSFINNAACAAQRLRDHRCRQGCGARCRLPSRQRHAGHLLSTRRRLLRIAAWRSRRRLSLFLGFADEGGGRRRTRHDEELPAAARHGLRRVVGRDGRCACSHRGLRRRGHGRFARRRHLRARSDFVLQADVR